MTVDPRTVPADDNPKEDRQGQQSPMHELQFHQLPELATTSSDLCW